MISAATIGFIFGSVLGLLFFINEMSLGQMFLMLIPVAILAFAMFFVWRVIQPKRENEGVDVVARTLATNESAFIRQVKAGADRGLLVPVVAQPVDGSQAFRSVILLRQNNSKEDVAEPEIGTLYPLHQIEAGMGELANVEQVSDEQKALMEKLTKRPRMLSNKAPALPMRRGPLERKPGWAALQWWASIFLAGIGAILLAAFLVTAGS